MNNKLNNNFSLRKLLLTALVAGPLATLPAPLWALPSTSTANLTTSPGVTTQVVGTTTLNVTAPDKAVLTWQAFGSGVGNGIASTDVINYFLPSSVSSVLNYVSGGVATTINGTIASNGNVYVLNSAGIILSPTAQINVGGFYASTVAEPTFYFTTTGTLSYVGTASTNIIVQGTGTTSGTDVATIQAVGPGNNIYLAANAVDVQGGKFFGNLFVRSSSTANPLAGGVNTSFASTGPVSVNLVGVPLVGGGLNVTSNGGNVLLTGAANSVTIAPSVSSTTGAVSINTVGNGLNGTITQGAGAFLANTSGTVVTLNAGTGTTAADITLGAVDFLTVGATGKNIAITDTAGGITLNGSTATTNLTVGSAGAILQGSGTQSVGGTITLNPAAGNSVSFTGSGNLTFAAFGANPGTTNLTSSGDINLTGVVGINSTTGGLTISSTGGQITATTITSNSTLTITATSSLGKLLTNAISSRTGTITVAGDISKSSGVTDTALANVGSGTLSVTSSAGNITLGAITAATNLNITATAGSITAGAVQTVTLNLAAANGTVTTGALSTANTATITAGSVTTGNINANNSSLTITASTGAISTGTIATNSTLTLSAPSATGSILTNAITSTTTRTVTLSSGGTVNIGGGTTPTASTIPVLSVTSTGGSITQAAAITSTSSATFNAAGDITLTNAANNFTTIVLLGGASSTTAGFQVVDADSIVIGNGTNARAATLISTTTNGTIALGNAAVDTIAFGSTLGLTASGTGTIITNANTVSVFGNVSLTTTNTAATLGSNIFGNAANYQFGQINASLGTGVLAISENTTLNLGAITAATLDARSLGGDIINTGKLTVAGNALFAANSIFSPGNVTLSNATNALAGAVIIGNAANFSLTNTVATTVTAGSSLVNGKAVSGAVNVTVTGLGNALILNTAAGGDYSTVGFNTAGAVTITDTNGLTIQNATNTGTGAVLLNVAGPIVLGSGIALGSSGATTLNSTGATASITDSAPNIRIFGNVNFVSDNSISITNTGHSLGAVGLTTTAANVGSGTTNITYTESGTANLANVSVGTGAFPGSLTVVSTAGNVQQAAGTTITVPNTTSATNTVSFTSTSGAVSLGNVGNQIVPAVSITAVGNSSVNQSTAQNLVLGNVTVSNGTFAASAANATPATITQLAGSTIKVFGNPTFNTQGGKITLNNSGNSFGGLTLNSTNGAAAGADIAITESGTMNFVSVNTGTAGKLAATSETAAIVQTGNLGVIVGGTTALTAAAGGITLNTTTTNNFGSSAITITTPGNVSIQDANAITTLGGSSNIGGSLSVKNNAGTGRIQDSPGNLTVTGNVLFDTTTTNAITGEVRITSSNASFGAVQFRSGTVTIIENATVNIGAGSLASGAVSLTSSGNIITTGTGGGSFQNTLTLNASGSITITNPIFVSSGLTFRALGAVNLSALSLAGNLNSIAPTNLGASTYTAPSP